MGEARAGQKRFQPPFLPFKRKIDAIPSQWQASLAAVPLAHLAPK